MVQEQVGAPLFSRISKNFLNSMSSIRNLQRSIFGKRAVKSVNMLASNLSYADKERVIKVEINIESTEDTIEIYDKTMGKKSVDPVQKVRMVRVEINPVIVGLSYWSLERIFSVVNSTLAKKFESPRKKRFLDNLIVLKKNLNQSPLFYLEHQITAARNKY